MSHRASCFHTFAVHALIVSVFNPAGTIELAGSSFMGRARVFVPFLCCHACGRRPKPDPQFQHIFESRFRPLT
jgi:hypothetical protein